jgi:hypothetical protein
MMINHLLENQWVVKAGPIFGSKDSPVKISQGTQIEIKLELKDRWATITFPKLEGELNDKVFQGMYRQDDNYEEPAEIEFEENCIRIKLDPDQYTNVKDFTIEKIAQDRNKKISQIKESKKIFGLYNLIFRDF